MKRFLAAIIVLILAFSCVACGESIDSSTDTPTTSGYISKTETTAETEYITPTATSAPVEEVKTTTSPAVSETAETVHKHTFRNATCSNPRTCTSCGETEGSANGHNWKDATCSEPKICTVCGNTSGRAAGHDFYNGECTHCGKADPDYIRETMVWIPNSGTKYHSHSSCSNMNDPSHVTKSYAESCGYTPCKKCY